MALRDLFKQLRRSYQSMDRRLGGYLPYGVSPREVEEERRRQQYQQTTTTRASTTQPQQPLSRSLYVSRVAPSEQYPSLRAASEITNARRRLEAAGLKPPEEKKSLWQRALDIIDRPGAFGRGVASGLLAGESLTQALRRGVRGFRGIERIDEMELLQQAAQAGVPFAQRLVDPNTSKWERFAGLVATGILLDPTTYITLPTKTVSVVKQFKNVNKLAPRIADEVQKATGRAISQESARRLAKNALEGSIPEGTLGAAIRRAMGMAVNERTTPGFRALRQAESRLSDALRRGGGPETPPPAPETPPPTDIPPSGGTPRGPEPTPPPRPTDLGDISRAPEPPASIAQEPPIRSAGRVSRAADEVPMAADDVGGPPRDAEPPAGPGAGDAEPPKTPDPYREPSPVRVFESAEPTMRETTLNLFGIPIANVTPFRTAMGAIVQRIPGMTRLQDALGRVFIFNYTPTDIKGLERIKVQAAKETIEATRALAGAEAKRALRDVLENWRKLGIDDEAAQQAPHIIEQTLKEGTTEAAQRAAQIAQEMFNRDVQRFQEMGIPLNVIDNYVTHLYQDPPHIVKQRLDQWRRTNQRRLHVRAARPFFTFERSVPTLEEAKKLGLKPIEDIRVLTAVHRALTEQAVVFQEMGRELLKMGDMVVSRTGKPGYIQMGSEIPSLAGMWVHPEVAKTLQTIYPMITNSDEGVNLLVRLYDSAINSIKALWLATPTFHLRNLAGGIWLNAADGVLNPARYAQAAAVMAGAIDEVELAGRRVPVRVIKQWFENYGLVGQGAFAKEVRDRALTKEAQRALAALHQAGFSKVAYYAKHPFQASREFGELTDSYIRMVNFLHHLDNGLSPQAAASMTRIALFDYGQLTPAERQIRRWIVPFYAWKRHSLPRVMERLLGAPGIFTSTAHVRDAFVNINDVDEEHLPEWLRENMAIPLWVDEKGNIYYVTLNLPMVELSSIHDPRDLQAWTREIYSMLSPFITTIPELASNTQIFTGQPITDTPDIPDEALRDYAIFLLREFGGLPGRMLASEAVQRQRENVRYLQSLEGQEEEVPPVERPFGGLLPISAQHPAVQARQALYRERDLLRQAIRAAEQRGIQVPDTEDLVQPKARLSDALFDRGRLGESIPVGGEGRLSDALTQPRVRVGDAPPVILEAMRITGVPDDWAPWLVYLMERESGGNPNAWNPTPAWRGEHATGLFQVIPSTFEQYKLPGLDDIWDPVHNAVAAIRYIQARYGHPSNIPGLTSADYRGY